MHILGYLIVGAVLAHLSIRISETGGERAWKYAMALVFLFALLVRYAH